MSDIYFANEPVGRIGAEIVKRIDDFYRYHRSSGLFTKRQKAWRAYYGISSNGSLARSDEITNGGEQGEISFVKVNHFRNLGQHTLTLTTAQRPAPIPISTNSDNQSHAQAVLAHGLIDYYMREKRVERVLRSSAEHSILFGEGYVLIEWDADLGEDLGVQTMADGRKDFKKKGDLRFSTPTVLDVVKDPHLDSSVDPDWVCIRRWMSKWELAARYPEFTDKILSQALRSTEQQRFDFVNLMGDTDQIAFWTFFHAPTKAVPDGRVVHLLGDGTELAEGPLPYSGIPLRRIAPGELIGSHAGYTPMFDLLALQELVDALYSAVATNQLAFGVQNIWVPASSNMTFEQLATGLNLITTTGDKKPEPLNLTSTPQEIFAFIKQLEEAMETLSGINSTVRGNPEASLKSGSALALVQSQAIQFSSGLQASYASLVEDVFTDAFDILRQFASTPRVALIVGKFNQYMLKEFRGSDLTNIKRVTMESGGSLAKTMSGRMQIAQDLLSNGLIRTPEQYMAVVNTGKLEPIVEAQTRELHLIRQENEFMREGKKCLVMPTDNHALHIKENATVINDPQLREAAANGDESANAILDAAFAHLQEHVAYGSDPALANLFAALEYRPIAPPMPVEQAAGGTPPGGGAPPPDGGVGPNGPEEQQLPTLTPEAREVIFPKNPVTGEQWDPATGGDALGGAIAANNVG